MANGYSRTARARASSTRKWANCSASGAKTLAHGTTSIQENIARIRERIASSATRAGRDPHSITLMAVSKTKPAEAIVAAYEAGIRSFGENRVQEFAAKKTQLEQLSPGVTRHARFSLIGTLQSNKVNRAVELFSSVQSVDSLKLVEKINSAVAQRGASPLPVTIEINTGDPAKAGLLPESDELHRLLEAAERMSHVHIEGLMTVPPFTEDPEGARLYFRKLRELAERIATKAYPAVSMQVLSMGMSHDLEVAIEEGSTCVRVGTAIFGSRPPA